MFGRSLGGVPTTCYPSARSAHVPPRDRTYRSCNTGLGAVVGVYWGGLPTYHGGQGSIYTGMYTSYPPWEAYNPGYTPQGDLFPGIKQEGKPPQEDLFPGIKQGVTPLRETSFWHKTENNTPQGDSFLAQQ